MNEWINTRYVIEFHFQCLSFPSYYSCSFNIVSLYFSYILLFSYVIIAKKSERVLQTDGTLCSLYSRQELWRSGHCPWHEWTWSWLSRLSSLLLSCAHCPIECVKLYCLLKHLQNVYAMIPCWNKKSLYSKDGLVVKVWDLSLIFVKQIFVVGGVTAALYFLAEQQASALRDLRKEDIPEQMKRNYILLRRSVQRLLVTLLPKNWCRTSSSWELLRNTKFQLHPRPTELESVF